MGDQKNRLVFFWWPSSGTGQNRIRDRIEFLMSAGNGLVTWSVI